jgi:pyruvate-ferredoxin/flavodoxin oxidoreductase
MRRPVPVQAPEFVQNITATMVAKMGDQLPVSKMPADGTFPTGTAQWEKRNIALEIPVWDTEVCIQCGKCVMVCPHSVIRAKVYDEKQLANAPETFKSTAARWKEFKELKYTLQVAPEDCTGCTLCVEVCPAKNKSNTSLKAINMQPQMPLRENEAKNWDFFLGLPEVDRIGLNTTTVKDVQLLQPTFEFSGACTGCGETPYLKLASQLFGDRMVVANATGCSSIYGGNLPTTPWSQNKDGRGPAWSNSLFEDNAEFGLGMRLTIDKQNEFARELVKRLSGTIGEGLADELLKADQSNEQGIRAQRERVATLKAKLAGVNSLDAKNLVAVADMLVKKSVWIIGGDGWAYDIGYGGLDHTIASGRNINILVLDTEVYSNTGGQASKATPRAAVAKFAAGGKPLGKKDLARLAMTYGNVYVAQIAMGANDAQTIKAMVEAESYDGPSIVIAYSHCIQQGIAMEKGLDQQKLAVQSAYWPLFRFDPRLAAQGKNPLQLDSKGPALPLDKYIYNETRYKMLTLSKPEVAAQLLEEAQGDVIKKWRMYEQLAQMNYSGNGDGVKK